MSDDRATTPPETGPEPARGRAPAPLAADVGVVAAMSLEVGFLTDALGKVRKYQGPTHTVIEGEHGGKVIALIVSGMGRAAARAALDVLIAGHRPRSVVNPGFGGALDPALNRNDVVLPTEILDPEGGRLTFPPREAPPGLRLGRLVTSDVLLMTARDKAELRARTGADVVDMESSALARLCAERALPYLGLRVISDEAGTDLAPEVTEVMSRTGGYLVGSALRSIWKRPGVLKDFWALHQQAQEAADKLAQVTLAAIARLD